METQTEQLSTRRICELLAPIAEISEDAREINLLYKADHPKVKALQWVIDQAKNVELVITPRFM